MWYRRSSKQSLIDLIAFGRLIKHTVDIHYLEVHNIKNESRDMLYQMALYQLPMLECSSCGQHLGHLYEDFYVLTKQLKNELENYKRPTGTYSAKYNGDDITEFVRVYYEWYDQQEGANIPVHEPANIVARALLRTQELDPSHLPFGSNVQDDGQLSIHEARICCLRMLQTDPMMTQI